MTNILEWGTVLFPPIFVLPPVSLVLRCDLFRPHSKVILLHALSISAFGYCIEYASQDTFYEGWGVCYTWSQTCANQLVLIVGLDLDLDLESASLMKSWTHQTKTTINSFKTVQHNVQTTSKVKHAVAPKGSVSNENFRYRGSENIISVILHDFIVFVYFAIGHLTFWLE